MSGLRNPLGSSRIHRVENEQRHEVNGKSTKGTSEMRETVTPHVFFLLESDGVSYGGWKFEIHYMCILVIHVSSYY